MSTPLNQSSERFSKTISFEEWFKSKPEKISDPATDIESVYSEQANQERFEANHPASKLYTVNPGDTTTQRVLKYAIRFFSFLLVIPIIIVKAADFFKGQKRTIGSDIEKKFAEIKERINSDRNRMLMTVTWEKRSDLKKELKQLEDKKTQTEKEQKRMNYIRKCLNFEMPLFKTQRAIDRLKYKAMKMFSGNAQKAAQFLNTLNQTPSYELRAQLRDGLGEILKAKYKSDDAEGSVDFGQPFSFLSPNESEKHDLIHLDFAHKTVTCVFDMKAQWMSGYGIEPLEAGIATSVFDFEKEKVTIVWETIKDA